MTPRTPRAADWEPWVERQIRQAQERGDFDALPGAGKPLPDLDKPHDELWWVRKKLREENLSYLPPSLQVRRERELAKDAIGGARSEREVRRIVATINARILEVNRTAPTGPPSTLMPLDLEDTLRTWREQRETGAR